MFSPTVNAVRPRRTVSVRVHQTSELAYLGDSRGPSDKGTFITGMYYPHKDGEEYGNRRDVPGVKFISNKNKIENVVSFLHTVLDHIIKLNGRKSTYFYANTFIYVVILIMLNLAKQSSQVESMNNLFVTLCFGNYHLFTYCFSENLQDFYIRIKDQ